MSVQLGRWVGGRSGLLAATVVSTGIIVSTSAQAQGAAPVVVPTTAPDAATVEVDTAVHDIMITSQGREQPAQTVPAAISAFSADLLWQRGVTAPLGLGQHVPNMIASSNVGLGSGNTYFIRGLGSTESIATFDPAVGTYIDGIYMSRQNANNFAFFDIDRVEVLRGPQGTAFGRNTIGGAVDIVLKKPSDTFGGYGEVGYGSFRTWQLRGSIDVPLNPAIQVKLSGYYQNGRGYVHDTTTGQRLNDGDQGGIRGAVQMKLTDNLTWNVSGAYLRNKAENTLNFTCDPNNPANCKGRFASTGLLTGYLPGTSPFAALGVTGRKANYGLGNKTDTQLYTSNIQWAADDLTVNFITGFIDTKQQYLLDFADGRGLPNVATPNPPVHGYSTGGYAILNDGSNRQFTQELKLSGKAFGGFIDYVAGAYYLNEKNRTDFADVFNRGAQFGVTGNVGLPAILADRTLNNITTSWAGYAQADANLSEQLKLTAGIRYTDDKKTIRINDNRAGCVPLNATCLDTANLFVNLPGGSAAIPTEQRSKQWTPRFAISYRPVDDVMVYASATRGFKSGGWNGHATSPGALLPFDPEKAWSYELGARTEFLDHRLRLNVTGFWLETKNLQTQSAFIDPASGAPSFVTQNAANYRNRGVEVEVAAVPVRGLNLYANVGYQKARYKISDTLSPNRYGVKAVRQQQLDCRAELAAGQVPLAPATLGVASAGDCAVGIVDANGNIATPVRTPDLSIGFGGSYDFAIPVAGIILTPSVNALHRSSQQTDSANASIYTGSSGGGVYPANPFGGDFISGSLTRAYWQVGAAITMRTDDNNWTLSLECQNCFDTAYVQSSLFNYSYLSPPRTWQLRAKRVF